jgi:ribosome-binding factor A
MKGLKDPRIGFVSVTEVRMSPDLRVAEVYVSVHGSPQARKSSLIGLQNATGWIRRAVGKKLRLRLTPDIRFVEDSTLDRVFRLEELFQRMHASEEKEHGTDAE